MDTIPGVRSTPVMLTPDIARRRLERNVHNRQLSEKVVQKYVAEIQADEWRITPAGIGFDDKGALVDGQHWLFAIMRSGKTVPIMVVTGLPSTSQEKVDRQRRHSQ